MKSSGQVSLDVRSSLFEMHKPSTHHIRQIATGVGDNEEVFGLQTLLLIEVPHVFLRVKEEVVPQVPV